MVLSAAMERIFTLYEGETKAPESLTKNIKKNIQDRLRLLGRGMNIFPSLLDVSVDPAVGNQYLLDLVEAELFSSATRFVG